MLLTTEHTKHQPLNKRMKHYYQQQQHYYYAIIPLWRWVRIPPPWPCTVQKLRKWESRPWRITGPPCHLGS
jgi:hypothetical protein